MVSGRTMKQEDQSIDQTQTQQEINRSLYKVYPQPLLLWALRSGVDRLLRMLKVEGSIPSVSIFSF